VAASVLPSKEMELRAPAAILDHVGRFREGFLRRFGGVQAEFSYVLPLLRRSLPTLRFVAFQLFGHAHVRQRDRACLGPHGIAVRMIAVVMRVEYVLDGLRGNLLRIFERR